MRSARFILAICLLAPVAFSLPAQAAPGDPTPMSRWLGAEGGFGEGACLTGSGAPGCLGFAQTTTFEGSVGAEKAGVPLADPDGLSRPWASRTGYRFFRASVPAGLPAFAYLTTTGAQTPSVPPLTASFGLQVHTLPLQPVVFFRQTGETIEQNIMLTLTPEGRIGLSAGSQAALSQPITTHAWHSLTITYGSGKGAEVKVYLDDEPALQAVVSLGAMTSGIELGIVSPMVTPFAIGFDDFVESPGFDRPTHGARINYLMPYGNAGKAEWTKGYPHERCREVAENWQLVAEDQYVHVPDIGDGMGTVTCGLEGGAISTSSPGLVDEYHLEGIPSKHVPTEVYWRDVAAQPQNDEMVLGVRLRLRAYTSGPPATILLGLRDQGETRYESFTVEQGSSSAQWSDTYRFRRNGQPFKSASLHSAKLVLDSGTGTLVERIVSAARLDYVWVPAS